MDAQKFATLIAAVVLAAIMLSSMLIPIVSSSTSTEATITNEGAKYSLYETGDTHTITFTSDSIITDGVAQPLPDTSLYGSATIVYGTGIFRYHSDGNVRFWGVLASGDVNRSLGSAVNVTIAIDETGTATATSTDESVTPRNFSGVIMYANPAGDYALSYNPYVVEDSTIYGCGNTIIEDTTYTMAWTGTTEGITVSWVYPPEQEIGTIAVNTTDVQTNLLKIDSIEIPIESAGGGATYTYFFAPKEITYENPDYAGESESTLLGVIPILVTVGIILGVIGMLFLRRE